MDRERYVNGAMKSDETGPTKNRQQCCLFFCDYSSEKRLFACLSIVGCNRNLRYNGRVVVLLLLVLCFLETGCCDTQCNNHCQQRPSSFLQKSAVFGAPITWLPLEKPAARPPPLLFCTKTRSVSNIAATKIKIVIKINIIL